MSLNLLEINNRTQQMKVYVEKKISFRDKLYRTADKQIFDAGQKAVMANLKYISRQVLDFDVSPYDEKIQKTVAEARSLHSYNQFNVFVWVRRFLRLERKYKRMHADYIRVFDKWADELTTYMEFLCEMPSSKSSNRLLDLVGNLQADIYNERYSCGELGQYKAIGDMSWLDLLIAQEFKMNKHDLLQLITIDRTHPSSLEDFAALPDELDYENFESAIFVDRIESDGDCYLFDLYYERMKKALSDSKEFRGKMQEGFIETFGPVQTYTVYNDENGQPLYMEMNKPNLRVISTDK